MLWLPGAMGLDITIYFELPSEPALWLADDEDEGTASGGHVSAALLRNGCLFSSDFCWGRLSPSHSLTHR
jgi:hypothetical protein